MEEILQMVSLVGALKVLATGIVAGAVAFSGIYWKQRSLTNSQIRSERFIAMIGETVYYLVEAHNHMHPEARIDTKRFAHLLFSIGVRRTSSQDESPEG